MNVIGARTTIIDNFDQWVTKYNINIIDNDHRTFMRSTWTTNNDLIKRVNSQNRTYTLGHNQFSGMTTIEFKEHMGLNMILDNSNIKQTYPKLIEYNDIPTSINWNELGAVTPVKDQGQCGSCWSFSTTGALEGAYYTKYGELTSFSEQQLVDCDTRRNGGKDMGCNGGLMDSAFSWINHNDGLCIESDYPYTSGDTKTSGTCQTTCTNDPKSSIKTFVDVKPSSDNDMMIALSKQPVSIAIEADQSEFQLYQSGVFTGKCGTGLDHGVLTVGYGSLSGQDYYLVKNSWSSTWGDGGYIKLGRGHEFNGGDGQCGMLLQASYPVL
jgi:KDEL-tailed cysteine endopeptidase